MESFDRKSNEVLYGSDFDPTHHAEKIRQEFEAANEHRDYSIYTRLMDAAVEAKALSLFPHFNVKAGDIIVDAGSGTGALTKLVLRTFPDAKVFALDISEKLQERVKKEKSHIKIVFGDAAEQNFLDNSVAVKYYSTSGHEIESFGGQGRMRIAMENTFRELKPGGRTVIRDFAEPSGVNPIYMKILSRVGVDSIPQDVNPEDIDYNVLSTRTLLERFQKEFSNGNAFQYERIIIDGEEYFRIDPEWAHEFYLRKDYTANWRQEIKEKYTYWTMEEAKKILEEIGYTNVRVIPDPNEYIIKNRLEGKIELYELSDDKRLQSVRFPTTHMVIVGEKPLV